VTASSPPIAERFREYGGEHVEVLENYVQDRALTVTASPRGDGDVLFGWLAGNEHHLELERVGIRDAVGRLLDAHERLRFRSIGVSLGLRHARFEHVPRVDFFELPEAMAEWDVGVAVIADIPFNHARSSIKVKEYAAVGLPWLASDVGPYRGLGEKQGGRTVPNDRWYEEIERLFLKERDRRKLARRARRWGREQAMKANAKRWEDALGGALERARARGGGVAARGDNRN
jgi:hypothetical protein